MQKPPAAITHLVPDAVVITYDGPATVGGTGRAHLHERSGGIGEMLWEALERAGWVEHQVTRRTLIAQQVGVVLPPKPVSSYQPVSEPLPGGVRRFVEGSWIAENTAWHSYLGPLNGRAAGPGYELISSERANLLEYGEDLLYTAGVRAGWLSATGSKNEVADVSKIRVSIGVARRMQN